MPIADANKFTNVAMVRIATIAQVLVNSLAVGKRAGGAVPLDTLTIQNLSMTRVQKEKEGVAMAIL